MATPLLRSRRRGATWFAHICWISRGGPGIATMAPPLRSAHQPGAVPIGLGSAWAEGIRVACLMLVSGIGKPRLANWALRWASRSSWIAISSPNTAAMVSRVRSSDVGPRPPDVRVMSERVKARCMVSRRRSGSSPTLVIKRTSMPSFASSEARKAELVSTSSPISSSVPMDMISAFIGSLRVACGRVVLAYGILWAYMSVLCW